MLLELLLGVCACPCFRGENIADTRWVVAHWSAAERTSATVSTIAGKDKFPAKNAAAASSFAALYTAVMVPPRRVLRHD